MVNNKNVFIISARRSGTHLLTDLIVNNFKLSRIDNSIDYDFLSNDNVENFIIEMSKGNRLAWSHYHDYNNFFEKPLNLRIIDKLKEIFHNSKIIFIYRDIRDVITSHYFRPYNFNKYESFLDYYHNDDMTEYTSLVNNNDNHNNLIDILIEEHKNWFSVYFAKEILNIDMEVISYEEIINDYKNSVTRISKFLEITPTIVKDVRLKSLNKKNNEIIYTAHDFRRGSIGDWKEVINKEWGESIHKKYMHILGNHVNAYLHNPKLHKFHDPETKYFQINSNDWVKINNETKHELNNFRNYFDGFQADYIINNRYVVCERKFDDVRYSHKVFFYENYVLKFLIPCKAKLDKNTFNYVIPIASKVNLLTILKTNKILYDLDIIPKLYYAGLHNGFLVVIQERIKDGEFIYQKFTPESNWNWMIDNELFPIVLDHFSKALRKNILLTDYISPFNLGFVGEKLKCVDLDGIFLFKNQYELKSSFKYMNQIRIFNDIDSIWLEKYGYSLLEKYYF